jgi:hypothetical protein
MAPKKSSKAKWLKFRPFDDPKYFDLPATYPQRWQLHVQLQEHDYLLRPQSLARAQLLDMTEEHPETSITFPGAYKIHLFWMQNQAKFFEDSMGTHQLAGALAAACRSRVDDFVDELLKHDNITGDWRCPALDTLLSRTLAGHMEVMYDDEATRIMTYARRQHPKLTQAQVQQAHVKPWYFDPVDDRMAGGESRLQHVGLH